MFFLGDPIDAEEAQRLGLINFVVAPSELEAETRKLAERLRNAPATFMRTAFSAALPSAVRMTTGMWASL